MFVFLKKILTGFNILFYLRKTVAILNCLLVRRIASAVYAVVPAFVPVTSRYSVKTIERIEILFDISFILRTVGPLQK